MSFSIVSGPATLSGNVVTLTGAGAVTLRAAQGGDANYNAAANSDLTFHVLPTVQVSPSAVTIGAGGSAGFTATIGGTTNVTYQWRVNETPILDATNQTLTLPNVAASGPGNYSTLISNDGETVTSGDAVLSVIVGFEADLVPRGHPNGLMSVADWVQVGRFAASLDTVSGPEEFMRADCAPRSTLGNGSLTVADWVQAGRYAAALDPLTPVGGVSKASTGSPGSNIAALDASPRRITASELLSISTESAMSILTLEAGGNENALGFTLNFDPSLLVFLEARLGLDGQSGMLLLNTNRAASGRVGVALTLSPGADFAPGSRKILEITFKTIVPQTTCRLSFGDDVIMREVVSDQAAELPVSFSDGVITVEPRTERSLRISIFPMELALRLDGLAPGESYTLEASTDLKAWVPIRSILATATAAQIESTPPGATAKYYRIRH